MESQRSCEFLFLLRQICRLIGIGDSSQISLMDKLKLAWDTFDFFTLECSNQEKKHTDCISTLSNFFDKNNFPSRAQRKRMKKKLYSSCDYLIVLYKKQSDALDELVTLHRDLVDIPAEREVDIESLLSLKNVTCTLIHQINKQKSEFDDVLG